MADEQGKITAAFKQTRQVVSRWWSSRGIELRVSFFMTAALILVSALVGVFFLWEGTKALNLEMRGRALFLSTELAAYTEADIRTKNTAVIRKKILQYFTAHKETLSSNSLLYLIAYDEKCVVLAGRTTSEIITSNSSFHYTLPAGNGVGFEEGVFRCELPQPLEPLFLAKKNGLYELTIPVLRKGLVAGFVRVGMYGQQYGQEFSVIMKKGGVALFGIFLVGLAFSRIIALGITRPILRLSDAVEKLRKQNWDNPIPVEGSDEISNLGLAFNQMAMTLKEREARLSRGNAELFILHTAGLDLMESLDRDALLTKISVRAEDLVRAETTAISIVSSSDRMLKYLGVFGSKAKSIQEQEMPIEAGGIFNWLASYGTPLLIPDAQADFRLDSKRMRAMGITTLIVAPLWSSNTMSGLLTAINKKGGMSFDKHDLRLFTVFSSLAAAALQNASLYGDLKGKMQELNTAQEQLVQSAKLAAIGELSANVAHEINNPLTSVLGYTTHLMKTLDIPESPKRILGMMEQEILRVRKFIRNLLDFARQKPSWMQPADIALPLRETTALVRGIAEATGVVMHEEYPSSPLIVNMDHNEMKQVFINIVSNALQVMPHGGDLRISLSSDRSKEVVVAFSDTGKGIEPEHVDKIFKPFFSTKSSGDGTGLGLSISNRIVANHGGSIEAESELGKGSVFRVRLPLHQPSRLIRNYS
jgi:signal transduction histidine kinase/HAMP domain-containing protein